MRQETGSSGPGTGWLAWIADEARLAAFDGSGWVDAIELGAGIPSTLGINAEADTNNRLALSSPASLFDHEGNGHRLKINKAGVGDTASLLLQTGYSGRAEIGTAGDDSLHVKVSPDGSLWHEAIVIDPSTGAASFPNSVLGVAGPVDGGAAEAPVDFDAAIDGGGAGTGLDRLEACAIERAFDGVARPHGSILGQTGEFMAASALRVAAGVYALGAQMLPGTVGFGTPDPAVPVPELVTVPRPARVEAVLVPVLAQGGANAALVLTRS